MRLAKILLPVAKLFPLDYIIPKNLDLEIGELVTVPFRNKEITGIVWELVNKTEVKTLKLIKEKTILEFRIDPKMLELIKWMKSYYLSELGDIAKLVLPVNIAEKPIKIRQQQIEKIFKLVTLSDKQQRALDDIQKAKKPVIIKGLTGSGKTEVYFNLIADYLSKGQQVLLMLPEIALSTQIISRFIDRFGFEPVIWNSLVTKAQKKMILRGILSDKIQMVIGTRSSLLLPFKSLGLIVIDEEHDDSYKQEEGVLYNARDTAVVRAALYTAKIVLCSATPSTETMYNAKYGKYQLITLSSRYNDAAMPNVVVIDMKKESLAKNSYISRTLITAIRNNIDNNKQSLLFLNRRGYAPLLLCKNCNYRCICKYCSSWMVVHKATKKLECHHCGYFSKIYVICPECKEESLIVCGPGIERIEEEIKSLFPNSRVAVISKDHIKNQEKVATMLKQMLNQEIDILIGTQIIAKGYHFPNLTLVGVIDADLGHNIADLRANERAYQLLHQVGGRAGREESKGIVYLQTYYPESVIFSHIQDVDDNKFFEYELETRKISNMPPFTKAASIILSGPSDQKLFEIAKNLVQIAPKANIRILGPVSSLIFKLAGKYRYRILLIADKKFNLQKYLELWVKSIKLYSNYRLKIDIDPRNFY